MTITGGELLVELLERNGVEYIFCSPGSEWTAVWEALLKREAAGKRTLKYINCRHEMLAVSVASGYALCTGKLPAVLLHSGIGTLHGSMALRDAYFAQVPMVVLAGETYEHAGDEEIRAQGSHWLGLLSDIGGPSSLVRGYVKWSNSIKSADSLIDLVSRGCRIAVAVPQGPVFLSAPMETLLRSYPECRIAEPYRNDSIQTPSPDLVEEAAERLVNSERPVIISDYAGRRTGAVAKLVELSETLCAPVFEGTYPIYANFPRRHPLYMGFGSAEALQQADTVLVVGGSVPWYPPMACKADISVTLLDYDPLHPNLPQWGYPIDLVLTADLEQGLSSLIAAVRHRMKTAGSDFRERLRYWQERHERLAAELEKNALAGKKEKPISENWLFHELGRLMPADTMVIDESITHMRAIQRYASEPGRYVKVGYGCLGVGIGEAIGTKIAHPDRPVLFLVGDGGFFYNPTLPGLGLCQEYNLPIIIAVMNNAGYIGMKRTHERLFPGGYAASGNTFMGVDITPAPNYAALASVFDARGMKLEDPEEIEKTIVEAFEEVKSGRTVVLDVVLS